jgi:hypothetical protein
MMRRLLCCSTFDAFGFHKWLGRGFFVLFYFRLEVLDDLLRFGKFCDWVAPGCNFVYVDRGLDVFSFLPEEQSVYGFLVVLDCLGHCADDGCLRIATKRGLKYPG